MGPNVLDGGKDGLSGGVWNEVKALGAKGVVKGSKLRVVWMMICGETESARVVSRVVVIIVLLMLRGFCVEELALEAMVFCLGRDDMKDLICRIFAKEVLGDYALKGWHISSLLIPDMFYEKRRPKEESDGGGEDNIQLIIDNFADKIQNMESNDALKMVGDADENLNITLSSVRSPLSKSFANILNADKKSPKLILGFFAGKRVAFSLVQNYVMNTWSKFGFQKNDINGFWMYKVVKRLKLLKKPLRKLLYEQGNIFDTVKRLRVKLDVVQLALDSDPSNYDIHEEEAAYLNAFIKASRNGDCVMGDQVPIAFLDYYIVFLGQRGTTGPLNSTGDDKSPGPDGFLAALFKEVAAPLKVNDYWPIPCCNVLFKCICKIISNRMKDCLKDLVSLNQSAFVLGRRISDNILLTQELMHNCHLDRGKRGLRQGDPMSPYLFTLVMEILTLMLHRRVRKSDMFTYHRQCSKLNIINLCFADDLFLFAHDDAYSAQVIMDALEEFKIASGLTPSKLSVKYLGVPLVPSRLVYRDCTELLERVKKRIYDWKNKSLSIARRAQLIRSVLSSVHVFWAFMFILSCHFMLELEQFMRGFLWCQGDMQRGKEKVAWESVCLPKSEGGLDDVRQRPPVSPVKQTTKLDTTSSSTRSHSQDLSDVLPPEFRRKREAAESVYDMKKQKDRTRMQCKELEFLTLRTDGMPEEHVARVNMKKEEIMRKYRQ
nr:hypothetical protein [Tanacetum cinerariifolium]